MAMDAKGNNPDKSTRLMDSFLQWKHEKFEKKTFFSLKVHFSFYICRLNYYPTLYIREDTFENQLNKRLLNTLSHE